MPALATLTALLDELEAKLPQLIEDHAEEGDFWSAFAGEADNIEDRAGEHCTFVHQRIDDMLDKHGCRALYGDGASVSGPKTA